MNILIDIGHPAHVHLLRNIYHQLIKNGHVVCVTVKDITIAKALLEKYNIEYINIGKKRDSLLGKALTQLNTEKVRRLFFILDFMNLRIYIPNDLLPILKY